MPTISVVMSVYQEPIEWMKLAIDSILEQTYDDFEFIIINDKPDRAENRKMLEMYIQIDKRIRVIHNERNIGLTLSLNRGLAMAQGEYIARMDADDIALPDRFQIQLDYLRRNPDVTACGGNIERVNEKGGTIGTAQFASTPGYIKVRSIQYCQLCHPASMFRRVVDGCPVMYNEERRLAQDYALWTALLAKGYILTNINHTLVKYRVSDSHISSKHVVEQTNSKRISRIAYLKALGFAGTSIHTIVQLIEKENTVSYRDVCSVLNDAGINKLDKKEFFRFIVELYCPIRANDAGKAKALCEDIRLSWNHRSFSLRSFYYILKK